PDELTYSRRNLPPIGVTNIDLYAAVEFPESGEPFAQVLPTFVSCFIGDHALQIAGSRSSNKVDIAARIHIGIATGSVNKMTGNRNNAAQMEKIAASTITGINKTNKNKTSINRSFG